MLDPHRNAVGYRALGGLGCRRWPTPIDWRCSAQGYDPYWGDRAPRTGAGYYGSTDLGGWRLLSLNSEGPAFDDTQVAWLRDQLRAHPGSCALAFDHKPRYSAAGAGDRGWLEPGWRELSGEAVALLSGHDHNYQRLRPVDGVTQFVVGTGGTGLFGYDRTDSRVAAGDDGRYGALRLELDPGVMRWQFIDVDGTTRDSGSLPCTPASGPAPPASTGAPAPAVGPGETNLSRGAIGVTGHGGTRAWSVAREQDGANAYRLVIDDGAGPRLAPVPSRDVPFDVDLGPDTRGRTVAVYSRCERDPEIEPRTAPLPMRAGGGGCDVFRLVVGSGAERRVAGVSTQAASEFLPSIWRGRIAFARIYERRNGQRGRLPYLYTRAGGRSRRQPGGSRGADGRPGPTAVELRGTRIAFTWARTIAGDRMRTQLRAGRIHRTARVLTEVTSARTIARLLSPQIYGSRVTVARQRTDPDGGNRESRLLRHRFDGSREASLTVPGPLTSIGALGSRFALTAADSPLVASGCGDPGAGCRLLPDLVAIR
ncbi:MAG: metallophosphoesterase family protein [Solirubrobacterales bacterium]